MPVEIVPLGNTLKWRIGNKWGHLYCTRVNPLQLVLSVYHEDWAYSVELHQHAEELVAPDVHHILLLSTSYFGLHSLYRHNTLSIRQLRLCMDVLSTLLLEIGMKAELRQHLHPSLQQGFYSFQLPVFVEVESLIAPNHREYGSTKTSDYGEYTSNSG